MLIQHLVIDSKFRNYQEKINGNLTFNIVNNQNKVNMGDIFSNVPLENVKRIIIGGYILAPIFASTRLSNIIGVSLGPFHTNGYTIPNTSKIHFYLKVDSTNNNILTLIPLTNGVNSSAELIFTSNPRIDSFSINFYEMSNKLLFREDFFECIIDYNFDDAATKFDVVSRSSSVGGNGVNGHGIANGETNYYVSLMNFYSNTPGYKNSNESSEIIYHENKFNVTYISSTAFYIAGLKLPNNNSPSRVIVFIENRRFIIPLIVELGNNDEKHYQNYEDTPKYNLFN